jgi:hypothetical protein
VIDWDAIEHRDVPNPSKFTAAQKAKATAAANALPETKPGKVDPLWQKAKNLPDISQLDFGDAQLQNVALKSLLASTNKMNRQKLLDHIAAGGKPTRQNPFTTEPLLTKTDEGLAIVDGHHRLGAFMLLGVKTLKAWVVPAT